MNPENDATRVHTFLDISDVLTLHELQLAGYGGAPGLRDRGLLESAVAQPQASFDGVLLHVDLFAMASAYLFHIVQNHPFVDGNKRTGLLAALVFLDLNGISVPKQSDELYTLTMRVASGELVKSDIAITLHRLSLLHSGKS